MADGLNVPIGRLRKLAEEGRLTADVVVNALMSQKGQAGRRVRATADDGQPGLHASVERLRAVGQQAR